MTVGTREALVDGKSASLSSGGPASLGMMFNHDLIAARLEGPLSWSRKGYVPTPEEVKKYYGPARTMGATEDQLKSPHLAMDSALDNCGAYSLIQHAFEMGQGHALGGQFMGYAALSGLVQNGLIAACINTVVDDMTRVWIDLNQGGSEQENEPKIDLKALEKSLKDFKLREVFKQAAALIGYFGGCLIFIDTGERDPNRLKQPLNMTEVSAELKNGGLKRFTVIEPVNTFPGLYNSSDPLSPDYYIPQTWWVLGKEVHASRLIHLHSGLPPVLLRPNYNFYGVPHAQVLFDYILHFQETRTAAQRLLTKFSLTALKTDMTAILGGGADYNLNARLDYFVQRHSNDGIMVIDKEREDLVKLETSLAGVTDIVKQSLELVAAINRTPAVKLLGISPSGFNATGDSDIRNYNDHIATLQDKQLRKGVETAITAIQISLFGKIDQSVEVLFKPLSYDDQDVKATIQKTKADTAAIYVSSGVLDPLEVRRSVADDPESGFNNIEVGVSPEIPLPSPDDFNLGTLSLFDASHKIDPVL